MPDQIHHGGLPARVAAVLLLFLALWAGFPGGRAAGAEPARRIVINLPAFKLYLLDGNTVLRTYPVAIGHSLTPSAPGSYRIIVKVVNPGWYPKKRPPVPPGPQNPLGTRWLGLSLPEVGIHGTNNPSSIGHPVSGGCIRMRNADVEELFGLVSVGTRVDLIYETLVVEPYPAWQDEWGDAGQTAPRLVDAAYPPYQLTVYPDVYRRGTSTPDRLRSLLWSQGLHPELDQARVARLLKEASGKGAPLPVVPQVVVGGRPARQVRFWEDDLWLTLAEASELVARPLFYWPGRCRMERGETWVAVSDLAARLGYQLKPQPACGTVYLNAPLVFFEGVPVARVLLAPHGGALVPVEPLAAAAGQSLDIDPCLGLVVSASGRATPVRLIEKEAYLEPERLAGLLSLDVSVGADGLWFRRRSEPGPVDAPGPEAPPPEAPPRQAPPPELEPSGQP
ncbi:MAG: L,D-transpeptidase [Chitinophagales bacterium]